MSPINIRQVREMAASEKADSERQPESGADKVIYTVGHSNHAIEHLISILKAHHIEVLIDIRTKPYSSYVPHFNRPNLEKVIINEGIRYIFMGDKLGGYPKDTDCYVQDGSGKRTPDYKVMRGKDWFREGLDAVTAISKDKRVVLMCSEEDPNKCHRHHLLSKSLAERGIRIIHIRGDGRLEEACFYTSHSEVQSVDGKEENLFGRDRNEQRTQSECGDDHSGNIEKSSEDEKCEQLALFPLGDGSR